jgi:hypothetical protein
MRLILALALVPVLLAGCTDTIPVKPDFGTNALAPKGLIPPEFAEFNNYDPSINALLASQICAMPYAKLERKSVPAVPGEIIAWRDGCSPFVVLLPP